MRALVLAGGGAKGAFQAGVLKVLYEQDKHFDLVIGTSVGAVNGFLWAYAPYIIEDEWKSIKSNRDVLSSNWYKLLWSTGLNNLNPLKKKLIETSKRHLVARCNFVPVVCDLKTGELIYWEYKNFNEMIKGIIASSSIPSSMELIDGRYADGGVREVVAAEYAKKLGADEITVIMNAPRKYSSDQDGWKPTFPKILSTGLRAIEIMQEEISWNDIKRECGVKIYSPDYELMPVLDFDPLKIHNAFEHGYNKAKV